jgi:hypothetical protein
LREVERRVQRLVKVVFIPLSLCRRSEAVKYNIWLGPFELMSLVEMFKRGLFPAIICDHIITQILKSKDASTFAVIYLNQIVLLMDTEIPGLR